MLRKNSVSMSIPNKAIIKMAITTILSAVNVVKDEEDR